MLRASSSSADLIVDRRDPITCTKVLPATIGQLGHRFEPSDEDTFTRVPLIKVMPSFSGYNTMFAILRDSPVCVLVTSAPTIRTVPTGSLIVHENAPVQADPALQLLTSK